MCSGPSQLVHHQRESESVMKFEHLDVRFGGRVAAITLDRPSKLNAITLMMLAELIKAAERISESDARTVVMSGTGTPFSLGMDLAETIASKSRSQHRDSSMKQLN